MCNIIHFPPNTTIPFEKLRNVTLNNPHGFGIVSRVDKKLEIFKDFNEKGTDPEFVAKELEKRKDVDSFLHLRYATAGEKCEENTHPFTVYKSKDHQIEFMHNGSLYSFKDVASESSDTRLFALKLLSPLLYKFKGDKGFADLTDPVLVSILENYFGSTNRGLLISNKYEPIYLGGWQEVTFYDGDKQYKLKTSNNDYFYTIQEGRLTDHYKSKVNTFRSTSNFPPTQQQKTETTGTTGKEQNKEAGEKTNIQEVIPLKRINLAKAGRFLTPKDLDGLFDGQLESIDNEAITYISYLSQIEIKTWLMTNPDAATRLIEHLCLNFACILEENEKLEEKKERGENVIASLKSEIRELERSHVA